jgi:2-(1,2-epoxy-1,2-dihydrophenyl)acetyl-CoA isomerase
MLPIILNIQNRIAQIQLNRPDKFNAFNREMALLLQQTLDDCAQNPEVQVIFITGNGKAFCAGQDLSELTGENAPGFEIILKEHYNPIVQRIRAINKPVVAAVNGVAAGAGANIALACDIVVAKESANFIQAFSKIGLIPDSGGTYTLPRLIGFQKAMALMLLGDKVSATEAERLGMIYKVFSDETFEAESIAIAKQLGALPALGLAYTKQALNASLNNDFTTQLALEDEIQYKAAHTYDYNEGVAAFLEKRQPVFEGR